MHFWWNKTNSNRLGCIDPNRDGFEVHCYWVWTKSWSLLQSSKETSVKIGVTSLSQFIRWWYQSIFAEDNLFMGIKMWILCCVRFQKRTFYCLYFSVSFDEMAYFQPSFRLFMILNLCKILRIHQQISFHLKLVIFMSKISLINKINSKKAFLAVLQNRRGF